MALVSYRSLHHNNSMRLSSRLRHSQPAADWQMIELMLYDGPMLVVNSHFWNYTSRGTNGYCAFGPRYTNSNFQLATTTGNNYLVARAFPMGLVLLFLERMKSAAQLQHNGLISGIYGSVVHGQSFADLLCVNRDGYSGDNRVSMVVTVDGNRYLVPNTPFNSGPGIHNGTRPSGISFTMHILMHKYHCALYFQSSIVSMCDTASFFTPLHSERHVMSIPMARHRLRGHQPGRAAVHGEARRGYNQRRYAARPHADLQQGDRRVLQLPGIQRCGLGSRPRFPTQGLDFLRIDPCRVERPWILDPRRCGWPPRTRAACRCELALPSVSAMEPPAPGTHYCRTKRCTNPHMQAPTASRCSRSRCWWAGATLSPRTRPACTSS
jgi:hypothetical protein